MQCAIFLGICWDYVIDSQNGSSNIIRWFYPCTEMSKCLGSAFCFRRHRHAETNIIPNEKHSNIALILFNPPEKKDHVFCEFDMVSLHEGV